MASPVPIPEAAKGVPLIATNDPVKLVILNKPDCTFTQKIPGYVVVDMLFFSKLIKCWNENRK